MASGVFSRLFARFQPSKKSAIRTRKDERRNTRRALLEQLENRELLASRLFAVMADNPGLIRELNPTTGAILNQFGAPLSHSTPGLAFDGSRLFYSAADGSSRLWELNPANGAVIDMDVLAAGTGDYDGLGMLNGRVYVQDDSFNQIFVFNPDTDTIVSTLNVATNIDGGLTGASGPDELISTFGGTAYRIDPSTGGILGSFVPGPPLQAVAFVGNELYFGSPSIPDIGRFSRAGAFLGTVTTGVPILALGSDATLPVSGGADDDFESGGFSTLPWSSIPGTASWFVTNGDSHSPTRSARSGFIGHGGVSGLRLTTTTAAGNISFWRKVDSEASFDFLRFYIDGVQQASWSGFQNWQQVTFPISAGSHTFDWIYSKDGSVVVGADAAFIDDVQLPGAPAPATGQIHGIKFNDLDANGVQNGAEPVLPGWTIFLDTDQDGTLDPGENSTVTDGLGEYSFSGLVAGNYTVAEVQQPGWIQTAPIVSTLAAGPNVNVSKLFDNQAEVTIAVNPTNSLNLIASSNDLAAHAQDPTWYSLDGGATWTLSPIPNTGGSSPFGDPTIAFDRQGNAYFAHLNGKFGAGLSVAKSINGGATWTAVDVPTPGGFADKEWLVVGPDVNNLAQDRIYIVYHVGNVQFVNSSPDGVAWTGPVQVSDPGHFGINAQAAVDDQGRLYFAWQEINPGTPGFSRIFVDKSLDGGVTWGTDVTAYTSNVAAFVDPFGGGLNQYLVPAAPQRGMGAWLSIDVDRSGGPNNGMLYIGLVDQGDLDNDPDAFNVTDHHNTDVFLIRSTDQGATWSAPVRANDDATTNTQMTPWMSVDQTTGDIAMGWYDARNDQGAGGPGDLDGIPNNDVQFFATASTSGGTSFLPNVQVSQGTSRESVSAFDYGEYSGIAFLQGKIFAAWSDSSNSTGDNPNGNSAQEVYFGAITLNPTVGPHSVTLAAGQTVTGRDFGNTLIAFDFDDAPASYGSADHISIGPKLGSSRDTEPGTFNHPDALGDDLNTSDDEDGLVSVVTTQLNGPASVIVDVQGGSALLDAWIDYNANGAFDDPAERITPPGGAPVTTGENTIGFTLPGAIATGNHFLRLRLSAAGGLAPTGSAASGEVEDYRIGLPLAASGYEVRSLVHGGPLAGKHLAGTTVDPATGNVYVATDSYVVPPTGGNCCNNNTSFDLYRITPAGVVSLVGNYPISHFELIELEWGPDGQIYTGVYQSGGGFTGGQVVRINPTTGATSIFSNSGFGSFARYSFDFDAGGNLIVMNETVPAQFYRINPGAGSTFLGAHPNTAFSDHGDRFAIQPDGDYVVFSDNFGGGNPAREYQVFTAGHVDGTPYPPIAYLSGTDIRTLGSSYVNSNGAIHPLTGDVYTSGGNAAQGSSVILFTPGNGTAASVSTLFVGNIGNGSLASTGWPHSEARGVTGLEFGPASNGNGNTNLYFLDDFTDAVYEVRSTITATTSAVLDGSGNLVITDIDGGDTDDTLTVSLVTAGPNTYVRVHDPNNTMQAGGGSIQVDPNTVDTLLSSITGNIQVNTLGGNDSLAVDYSGGVFGQAISYDGGGQTSAPGDGLAVKGAGLGVVSQPNGGSVNAFSGNVQVTGGGVISYQNIEPLDIDGGGGPVTIFPAAGADVLTIANGANLTNAIVPLGTQDSINISGTTGGGGFETHAVWNASTLTIDTASAPGSDGADGITLMTVSGTGARAVTNFLTNTGSGADTIEIDGSVTFPGTVTLLSQQIDFNNLADIWATNVTLNAFSGSITDGDFGSDVVANMLDAAASTGVSLDTTVASLVTHNFGSGPIDIAESDGVTLMSVINADGPVTITAGGLVTVMAASVNTDSDANDISISTTSGNIDVHMIAASAGAAADVFLTASGGAITDPNGSGINVTADDLVAVAAGGIDLDTVINRLEANGGTGGVNIENAAALTIGGITALQGVSATGGNIVVSSDGSLSVDEPVENFGGGDIDLTAASTSSLPVTTEALVNGDFESGSFAGWAVTSNGPSGCDRDWIIGTTGSATQCLAVANPTGGIFAAYNSFDGDGPQSFELTQSFLVPTGITAGSLSWRETAAWSFGGPNRVFQIDFLDAGNSVVGTAFTEPFAAGNGSFGWITHSVDVTAILSAFEGQQLTLRASNFIPLNFSGPAGFGADEFSLQITTGSAGGSSTLYGSDRNGPLFTIDLGTGAGTLVGNLPSPTTEIEYDPLSGRAFLQFPDGSFAGQEFDINTAGGIGPAVPNGGSFTGLEWVGSTLYGTVIFSAGGASELRTLDPFTGTSTPVGPTGVGPIAGLAYNSVSGIMYGIAGGPGPANLYSINLATGAATLIGNTSIQAGSLEFGPDGNLYAGGSGAQQGNLYRINSSTGASTFVGVTGFGTVSGLALVTTGGASTADLLINAPVVTSGGNGNVTLNADRHLLQNAGVVSATGSGELDYNASLDAPAGVITMAAGTQATSGTGNITMDAMGDITIALAATAGDVIANSPLGAITGINAGPDVIADDLVATAQLGIDLDTTITTLFAQITSLTGNVRIDETDDLNELFASTATGQVIITAGGAISDSSSDGTDIMAGSAALMASNGIGSGNALETAVSNLSAENSAIGNIEIDNAVGGLLTLTNLPPVTAGFAVRNTAPGGAIVMTNASPVIVAANVVAAGPVVLTAGDTAAAGDDLTVNGAIIVQSTGSSVTLNAGDDASIGAGAYLAAATTVTINVDAADADLGVGGVLTIDSTADIDAVSATFNGNGDNDTFSFRPDDDLTNNFLASPVTDTPISVNGFAPTTFPGDTLNLDISGLSSPTLTIGGGPNDGAWSFGNAASVTYTSIEDVNVTPPGVCYGLILDLNLGLGAVNGAAADTINAQRTATDLELRVNGGVIFTGNLAEIDHLTVLGSADADTLEIQETPSGLPAFCDPAAGPADGHTSPTFTAHTGYDQAGGAPVDIHFNGNAGADAMSVLLLNSHAVVYTSDALDTSKSGNVGIGSGGAYPAFGAAQLGISFESLAPLTIVGAGGTLTADASSSPDGDVTSLTIADAAGAGDGISSLTPNLGSTTFEPVTFSGFTGLVVRSGGGADTLDLVSLDSASVLTEITLDADNLANTDASSDTVRVQSTGGVNATVRMLAGAGNDSFQVLQLPAGTIDGLAGQVLVSPVAGSFLDDPALGDLDTLSVSDVGDLSGDNVTIDETSIEGLTGFAGGPDIDYRAIDTLVVTTTSGADVIDIALDPGSDLDTVTVNGAGDQDQFYLNLNTANDTSNDVAGLTSVNLNGNAGGDTFGETPANAPPNMALPPPPAPLPAPIFPLGKGKIRPSTTTSVNIDGGPDTIGPAPTFNATAGNVYGPNYDLLNLDMSDRRGSPAADTSIVVVSTVSGVASLTGFQNVGFRDIEAINLCDQDLLTRVEMGDLYVRTTENADVVQFSRLATPGLYRVRINSQFFNLAATTKTIVYGRGGNDTIQQTNVTLDAEFYGEEGNDYLAGYTGNDLLVGGLGDDRVLGGAGNNELWGDNLGEQDLNIGGFDQISGGANVDVAYGGGGNDIINLGGGNDYAFGGWGNDSIDGMEGDDRLYGGEGDDTITGYLGNDLIAGNNGNDKLYGRDGHDVVIGGDGADLISGEGGDDLLINGIASYDPAGAPPPGTDASTSAGDANDAAMLALLADWVTNKPALLGALTTPDDNDLDNLTGGLGTDRARRGASPLDTGDWEGLLP